MFGWLFRKKAPKQIELTELEFRIFRDIARGNQYLRHVGGNDDWPAAVDALARLGLIDRGDRHGDNRAMTELGREVLIRETKRLCVKE